MARKTKGYSAREYEVLFRVPTGQENADALRASHRRVSHYRTKDIIAGDVREIEAYPVWNTKTEASAAKSAKKKQREAQEKLNDRNLKKKIERRANASFGPDDLYATLTYEGTVPDERQAREDMQRYIRNVRGWRRRRGLPEMRYIYAIEFGDAEGNRKRIHAHILMTGMDRDAAEKLWKHGRANTRRLQPDRYGLARIVGYMLKAKRSTRRVECSRNIIEPEERTHTRRLGRRKAEKLAAALPDVAREVLEAMHPGWEYVDCTVRSSEFVAGAYVYARMRKAQRKDGKS